MDFNWYFSSFSFGYERHVTDLKKCFDIWDLFPSSALLYPWEILELILLPIFDIGNHKKYFSLWRYCGESLFSFKKNKCRPFSKNRPRKSRDFIFATSSLPFTTSTIYSLFFCFVASQKKVLINCVISYGLIRTYSNRKRVEYEVIKIVALSVRI